MPVADVEVLRGGRVVGDEGCLLRAVVEVAVVDKVQALRGEPGEEHHVEPLYGVGPAAGAEELPELAVGVAGRREVVAADAPLQEHDGGDGRERRGLEVPPRMELVYVGVRGDERQAGLPGERA